MANKGNNRVRAHSKGRQVDAGALEDVRALLGDEPRRRDLLIEHLHKINDRYGHLSAAHLAALAEEMRLSQTEVYEVATFYHHFHVVKEGETPPPALTVRVCDSIACELAGSEELLEKLPGILGKAVQVLHAPCVGRCEVAPVAVVGQNPVGNATVDTVRTAVEKKQISCPETDYIDFAAYKKDGGYKLVSDCLAGKRTREALTKIMGAAVGKAQLDKYYQEESERCLDAARKKLDAAGVRYEAHSLVGPVAESLVKLAKDKRCDLICIGTRGHSELGKALMGSTATKVLHISDVPVLLVK